MISDYHYNLIMKHADRLNSAIIYDRDFSFNYFGFKVCVQAFSTISISKNISFIYFKFLLQTLERSYLLKINGKAVERPQHMMMRVAVGIHGEDLDDAIETYNLLSEKWFTHASPTLFNAATPRPQLSR